MYGNDTINAKLSALAEAEKRLHENTANCYQEVAPPCRPSLQERVGMDLDRARRESRKREHLEELAHLLAKNPEMARILDLLDDVRS